MKESGPVVIAVCGAGECSRETAETAEEVGRAVAKAGAVLICGGLGGVMEAAARGAAEAGGLTIGVLPGKRVEDANPWIKAPVATGMGEARNAIIVRSAHGVIAVAGSYGTLSEIALALKMGKPVASLSSWEVTEDVMTGNDPLNSVKIILDAIGR